jgi:LysR family transcriptional regulator, glycine cleavage system transcriptional activator
MLRRLPPLNALKAFEAAARHESFTRAAEELCVTQGAVSHQVKALEATLGLKLFNRERQRLVITEAGRDYLAVLRDAFDRIALGTARVVQRQSSGVLTVSTSPDFAAKWLVNRLGHFAEAQPDIDLRVSATLPPRRLRPRGGRSCGPPRRGLMAGARRGAALLGAALSGLQPEADDRPQSSAPAGRPPAAAPAASRRLGRLAPVARGRRRAGRGSLARTGPQPASMVIDAAIDGQGVALARTTLAASDLINGRLVRPFDTALRLPKSYWIICPKATVALPKISLFRTWLLREAAEDARRLRALG